MTESINESKVVENKAEAVESKVDNNVENSIFVTENDTFDVVVELYKDNGKVFVKDVDSNFDITRKAEELKVTIKYPSQGDVELIYAATNKIVDPSNPQEVSVPDFLRLELSRLLVLIRKWSVSTELTTEKVYQLNPKIVKSIVMKMRTELGMDGII